MEKEKKKLTTGKIVLIVVMVLLSICLLFFTIVTTMASTNRQQNLKFSNSFDEVDCNYIPKFVDGYWTYIADGPMKIMQISDVQLGGGWLTKEPDLKALNAIGAMVMAEEPDLVIFTGDISYCNPAVGASLNNLETIRLVCRLMESMRIYYTFALGNQDSERQSLYTRSYIADFLSNEQFYYGIFEKGPKDISGYGNQIIKVKNTDGIITQAIVCFDSNSYEDKKISTAINAKETNKYGYVKDDQITWYENEIKSIDENNKTIDSEAKPVNSLIFMHLPPYEMKEAFNEFRANSYQDTKDVKYIYGDYYDDGVVVHSSNVNTDLFERVKELKSTKGIFFGHDQLNTIGFDYQGIRMEYCGSLDYLSKKDIDKYGQQRGCKIIMFNPDGTLETNFESYYQEKYVSKLGKETVILDRPYCE